MSKLEKFVPWLPIIVSTMLLAITRWYIRSQNIHVMTIYNDFLLFLVLALVVLLAWRHFTPEGAHSDILHMQYALLGADLLFTIVFGLWSAGTDERAFGMFSLMVITTSLVVVTGSWLAWRFYSAYRSAPQGDYLGD